MLAYIGYAQEPNGTAKAKTKPGAGGAIEVAAISATSKVTAVDPAKRTVLPKTRATFPARVAVDALLTL